MHLKLVKPSLLFISSYIEAVDEGFENMQLKFGDFSAATIKKDPSAYIDFLHESKPFKYQTYSVHSHELLWFVDEESYRFLGSVAVRYQADDFILYDFAGHLGMSVRPSVLQKGYGVKMGEILFDVTKQKIDQFQGNKVLATCYKENRASARLIEYFGGKLRKEIINPSNQRVSLIYEMELD